MSFLCLFAVALLAPQLRAAETAPAAAGAGGGRIDRYALEHYLTDLAEGHWRARRTTLANLKSPTDVTARANYIRAEFNKAIGGFPETRTPLNARITGTLVRDGYRIGARPRGHVDNRDRWDLHPIFGVSEGVETRQAGMEG